MLNLVVVKLAMDRFAGPRLGLALGCILSAFPLGVAAATLAMPWLATLLGWRLALGAGAGCLVLLLLASPLMGAGGPAPRGSAPRAMPRRWAPVMVLSFAWVCFNLAYLLTVGFGPALLVGRGMTPAAAGQVLSLVSWGMMATLPLAGWLASRSGRPVALAMAGLCGMVATLPALALLPPGVALAAAAAGFGAFGGVAGTPIFALTARVLPPEARALGMGGFYTLFYLGMAALPPLAGWLGEASGVALAPLWCATLCTAAAGVATLAVLRMTAPQPGSASASPGDRA
jgi:MFS family permease